MFLKRGREPQPATLREMIVECFALDTTTNSFFVVIAPEHNRVIDIAMRFGVKDERAFVGHSEHPQDRQHRGQLDVLGRPLEARDCWRADFSQRGKLLLCQL